MTAIFWGIFGILRNRKNSKFIVLCYHGITPNSIDKFQWQMKSIAARATSILFSNERIHHLRKRVKVCVTFDDAFANLLENALPVLVKYQIPAIFFSVAGNMGFEPCWKMPKNHPDIEQTTMTREQLISICDIPLVDIGSHTFTHPDLTKIQLNEAKKELEDSKIRLESILNRKIEDLALPYGSYNASVINMAKKVGYKRIYTLNAYVAKQNSKSNTIDRFSMEPNVSKLEFLLTSIGAYEWLGPCRKALNYRI